MKRIAFLLLILVACSKPDDTFIEHEEQLWCTDCCDILTHVSWVDCFCGSSDEVDRFIVKAREEGNQVGMIIYCNKHKH